MQEIFLSSSLNIMQNLCVISHTVCAYIGGPKILGEAGAPLPWNMGVAIETCPVHMCYHAGFPSSMSHGTSVITEICR